MFYITRLVAVLLCISVAEAGLTSDPVIILPHSPNSVERLAGIELRRHIEKAIGRRPALYFEPQAEETTGYRFYVGNTHMARSNGINVDALTPNSCRLKVQNRFVIIAGNDGPGDPLELSTAAGTLLGVYEFLEKQLGVNWIWPEESGVVVPSIERLELCEMDVEWTPKLEQSRLRMHRNNLETWPNLEAGERFYNMEALWLRRQRFAITVNYNYGHAFTDYWKRFGEAHPDYFNLLPDGTRRPDPLMDKGNPARVSLNVSNQDLWAQIVNDWQADITADKPWINANENDGPGLCTCNDCLSWDSGAPLSIKGEVISRIVSNEVSVEKAREAFAASDPHWYRYLGSLSDRYCRFYLALLTEGRKREPNAKVIGDAYANRREPPVSVTLNRDVIIRVVPALMFPWTEQKQESFYRQWSGWSASGATLLLRPNYMLDGHAFPIYFAHHLPSHFKFAVEHRLAATDFDSLTGQWATQAPNLYTLARLHQDPGLSYETIMEEFTSAFGPAQENVRAYFEHWRVVSDSVTQESYGGNWLMFLKASSLIFTPEVLGTASGLFKMAEIEVRDQEPYASRVAFLRIGFEHIKLCLQTELAYHTAKGNGDWSNFKEAHGRLEEFRSENALAGFADIGFLTWLEQINWARQ